MTHYTGNVMYDAVGSMLIGCLLGAIASFLVQRNRCGGGGVCGGGMTADAYSN